LHRIRLHILAFALFSCLASGQAIDNDKVWREFIAWLQTQESNRPPAEEYKAKLIADGFTEAQADERVALIGKLYEETPEFRQAASNAGFNKLYRTQDTQTRFTLKPNAFLVSVLRNLKPGKALDVAMGQGRNAVYVASQGWDVTGYDPAEEALKAAAANAARAGVKITAVNATFDSFDYGKEKWDLIYFIYTDAPTMDAAFIARIKDALKPGGLVLLDRPFRSLKNPEPGWPETAQDKPNAHLKAWGDFHILFYQDTEDEYADWQQTAAPRLEEKRRIVRFLARKM